MKLENEGFCPHCDIQMLSKMEFSDEVLKKLKRDKEIRRTSITEI